MRKIHCRPSPRQSTVWRWLSAATALPLLACLGAGAQTDPNALANANGKAGTVDVAAGDNSTWTAFDTAMANPVLEMTIAVPPVERTKDIFPRPDVVVPNVEFWKRVYAEWSVNEVVFHDTEYFDLVYRVVKVPKREEKTPDGLTRNDVLGQAKKELVAALASLDAKQPTSAAGLEGFELELYQALEHNPRPDKYQRAGSIRLQSGMRERFRQGYINAAQYEDFMKSKLRSYGVPDDLIAVAYVESLFAVRAKSNVGAAGVWQFMRMTAHEYMTVNDLVDERYDPWISTEAAAKYLAHSIKYLDGDWGTAVTSYNYGKGGMRGACRTVGTCDFGEIFANFKGDRFGFAAKNYYACVLAVHDILEQAELLFADADRAPLNYDVVRLPFAATVPQLVSSKAVETGDIFCKLNPALSTEACTGKVPMPQGFSVRVPTGTGIAFLRNLAALPEVERNRASVRGYHKSNGKKTLAQIAAAYNVSVEKLEQLSGVSRNVKPAKGTSIPIPGTVSYAFTVLDEAKALPVPPATLPPTILADSGTFTEGYSVLGKANVLVKNKNADGTTLASATLPGATLAADGSLLSAILVASSLRNGVLADVQVQNLEMTGALDELPGVDVLGGAMSVEIPNVDVTAGGAGASNKQRLSPSTTTTPATTVNDGDS